MLNMMDDATDETKETPAYEKTDGMNDVSIKDCHEDEESEDSEEEDEDILMLPNLDKKENVKNLDGKHDPFLNEHVKIVHEQMDDWIRGWLDCLTDDFKVQLYENISQGSFEFKLKHNSSTTMTAHFLALLFPQCNFHREFNSFNENYVRVKVKLSDDDIARIIKTSPPESQSQTGFHSDSETPDLEM
jgi:hypothetical protein